MAHLFNDSLLKKAISFEVIQNFAKYHIVLKYKGFWPFNKKTIIYPFYRKTHPEAWMKDSTYPHDIFYRDIDYISNYFRGNIS